MIDILAALHQVDYRAVGLEDYGRIGGYMTRQMRRWVQQYEASKTNDIPAMERLMAWLPAALPADTETTIVHGDFRLENMIFHPTETRVLAVVDWELSTLGAPLSDLAYNCLPYYVPDEWRGDITGLDFATYGIPSEDEYVARYCERTGRSAIPEWTFYVAFSLFDWLPSCRECTNVAWMAMPVPPKPSPLESNAVSLPTPPGRWSSRDSSKNADTHCPARSRCIMRASLRNAGRRVFVEMAQTARQPVMAHQTDHIRQILCSQQIRAPTAQFHADQISQCTVVMPSMSTI